ncbi:unnamed protein product [Amoebophrya sp. A25]|nr:unnamed protein product [Amoebophrya sp. A25]|eukprot:GSA25T00020289001.1
MPDSPCPWCSLAMQSGGIIEMPAGRGRVSCSLST